MTFFKTTICFVIFLGASCSVTKRHYRNGFFIQHHAIFEDKNFVKEIDSSNSNEKITVIPNEIESVCSFEKKDLSTPNETNSEIFLPFSNEEIIIENEKINLNPKKEFKYNYFRKSDDEKYKDNSQIAKTLAHQALKKAILAIIFFWLFFIGFPLCLLAQSTAKQALVLNDGVDNQVENNAKNAILISNIILIIYSISVIILITVLIFFFVII